MCKKKMQQLNLPFSVSSAARPFTTAWKQRYQATSPSKNEHEANEKNNHVTANLQFSWTR
jgi:hypothetical protein